MNLRQLKEFKMSVKMSDALRESINDINEILYAQKLIDKKEYERVSAQFPMAAVSTEMDGRQFAQIRRKLNLSQAALGQILGTSVSTISKWECGKNPIIPSVIVLMNVLDKHGLAVLM